MIFKTITDETTLSGQRIVGALQARKIAQQQATAQLEIDIACLKEYQVACQNGTVTTEQFDAIMHKASASAVEYSAKVKAGTGTAQSYANAQRATNSALQEVSIGAGIASKAVKLFSTALNMIAFTAIIQGISWLIGKVDEWIVTAKEAKESADAFKQSLSTFFNETQTNLKTISSLSDRFNELSKNVDDNGKKVGGTEEEYAEFLDICQQVGQIMPELITGYTAEGEAIITLQGKVDSLTDSYREAIRTKAALFLSNGDEDGNSIKSFFEDYNNFVNGYQGVLGLKTSPSGQNTAEEFEEYYGYDKIHGWLSDVTDATLEDLEKLRVGTTEYVYLARVLKEAGYEISEISAENYNAVHDVFNNRMSVMEKGITDRVTNIRTAFQNMLYADSDYWKIDDENVISAINSLYASIDDEFIKQNELFNQTALQTFESDFVSLFNNDATKKAMVDFYTPIADDETVQNYTNRVNSALQEIQSYCNNNGIVIPIEVNNSIDTLVNSVKEKLQDDFDDKVGELTLEELHIAAEQVEVPEGTLLSWDELIAKIKEVQSSTLNIENPISSLSISDTIDQLNTQLKPAFDSLKSAFQSIFTSDGYNSNAVDIPMLESIKSSIEEINELEDVDITIDMDAFDSLATTLADINTTEEQAKQAFNDFATSIFYATNATDGMTEETKELVEQLLESLGIVNATEVAEYALAEAKAKDMLATYDLINAKESEYVAILAEGEAAGIARQQLYKLMAAEIAFGNNDLNTEQKIEQLRNLAKAYGDTASAALATAIANDLASGHTDVDSAINDLMAQVNSGIQKVDIDFSPIEKSAAKAGSSAGKSYADALKDELSNLNSVINYIGDTIDDQIDLFEDQKDAAVDALEAEKEAAEEALEAEKELVQGKIDAKQAEIDAIEDAAIARKNSINLQKEEYNLERMQNQKTILQYSESKGMHYVTDTKEIREAREAVTEAKENIQIAGMEKEISGLNDIIDDLDKKIEESNKYYDELIDQAEKYWDGLIKGLEEYKSRWKELADIEEQAKMEVALRNLGITTEDVLNMSESAFESFKGTYLGLLSEMYSGNDDMINMLQKVGGISTDTLRPLSGTITDVADSLDKFSASTGNAGTSTSAASENVGNLSTNTSELNGSLSGVSDTLDNMLEDNKLETIAEQMGDIAESVQSLSDALNDMPTDLDMSETVAQFDTLGNSVDKVSASISGGNVSKADTSGGTSGKNTTNTQSNYDSGSGSLVSAIKEVKSETDKSIGTGGDSGAIGQFNQLGESVEDVTSAIGGGSGNRNNNGNESSSDLVSSIENLGETTTETLGEPDGEGVIGRFGEMGNTIAEAENHVHGIINGMNELDGMTAECSIVVNVETVGGVPAYADGTAISDTIDSMGSGEYHPKYEGKAHVEGTANMSGNWGVSNPGRSLVGEEGQELWVHANNGTFETVGDHGAEFINTEKNDIIFNHLQTQELLKRGSLSGLGKISKGKAYINGTNGVTVTKEGNVYTPYNPDTDTSYFAKLYKAWTKHYGNMDDNVEEIKKTLAHHVTMEYNQKMHNEVNNFISRSNSVVNNNNRNVQPVVNQNITLNCPNVTNTSGVEYLQRELGNLSQRALQESMKR